jgi:hypothetical protein
MPRQRDSRQAMNNMPPTHSAKTLSSVNGERIQSDPS